MHRTATRILIALLALALLATASAQDDWDEERLAEGTRVYLEAGGIGCHTCHSRFALGDVGIGPVIRGVDAVRIQGALEAAEEMGFLLPILSQQNIDDVAYYLQWLDTLFPVKTLFRRGTFEPAALPIPPATRVQLIVQNGNRSACTLVVDGVTDAPVEVAGRGTNGVVFDTPAEGLIEAHCTEAPDAVLRLPIAPSAEPYSAPPATTP